MVVQRESGETTSGAMASAGRPLGQFPRNGDRANDGSRNGGRVSDVEQRDNLSSLVGRCALAPLGAFVRPGATV